MDLSKMPNDIPEEVRQWGEEHASSTGYTFASIICYVEGEIIERAFGMRRYKKHGVMITEVRRRATGGSRACVKNIIYFFRSGYVVVFKKEDRFTVCSGYPFKTFDKENFDIWFPSTGYDNFFCTCINADLLKSIDEFKYCGYSGGDVIDYLNKYRKNPMLEIFGKMNLPASSLLIKKAETDKSFRTFLYKNVEDVIKFGPQATVYAHNHQLPINAAHIELNNRRVAYRCIPALRKTKVDINRVFDYCDEYAIDYRLYNDYIQAVKELGFDLNDTKNIYPKKFMEMHDLRTQELESKKTKIDREKRKKLYVAFAKAGEKARRLEFSDNTYRIISAKDIAELVAEGKTLGHCVGKMGYDKKMADEKSLIMFVRQNVQADIPFVTVELDVKNNKVLQAYGAKNSHPDEDVMNFISRWIAFVKEQRKVKKKVYKFDVQAFIDNVEFGIDWNLPVSKDELERYEKIIKEREQG